MRNEVDVEPQFIERPVREDVDSSDTYDHKI